MSLYKIDKTLHIYYQLLPKETTRIPLNQKHPRNGYEKFKLLPNMITFTGLLFFLLPRGKTIRTSLWQMNFNFPISIIMPSLTGEEAHPKSTHKQAHTLFLSRTRSCKEEAAEEKKVLSRSQEAQESVERFR